ncbi:uncharacterized protein TNCV_3579091 [Trichonephila clavipes]|nr:uncharacterized protein TNCV_3579091 [Trichonephila clavipes]
MSRSGDQFEARSPVFKSQRKLGTHLSTHCSSDERLSRFCPAREWSPDLWCGSMIRYHSSVLGLQYMYILDLKENVSPDLMLSKKIVLYISIGAKQNRRAKLLSYLMNTRLRGPKFKNCCFQKSICQVIYSQFGLAIHQNDHQARRRFVEWAQNEIAVVPDFNKRILFSDEVHFWLNGYVNKQNCRIWSEANPQVYVETPLHPEKLTVWCAFWAGGILLQKR